ncbi:hypothetical protein ACHAWF_017964, partial [Thalassiosira exigua]
GRLVGGDGDRRAEEEDDDDDGGGGKGDGKKRGKRGRRKRKKKKESRPKSGLFDPDWSTRSNCAAALERVARCLPSEDRRHFFEGDGGFGFGTDGAPDGGADGASLWLSASDLARPAEEANEGARSDRNHLDVVAERGRLLLSSSGEGYDWDCDGDVAAYVREREALRELDATAAAEESAASTSRADESKEGARESFLRRRVALQRRILARRLGLGGVLGAPIAAVRGNGKAPEENPSSSGEREGGGVLEGIVADEDLAPKLDSSMRKEKTLTAKKKGAKQPGKRPRKGTKKPTKRRRTNEPETSNADAGATTPVVGIRALLVLESGRSAGGAHRKRVRHRNPQTLLGSELAYRTFDPDWTVRHGALLGTLALLRAWRIHEKPRSRNDDDGDVKGDLEDDLKGDLEGATDRKFGRWPQDILARCICVLALDQFADFSGDSFEAPADGVSSGAAVAPVRETAAQIVALLLEASPPEVGDCAHRLLTQLHSRKIDEGERGMSGGWERRHGALLAWKYVCAVASFRSRGGARSTSRSSSDEVRLRPLTSGAKPRSEDLERWRRAFDNIVARSTLALSDASDDNRAVAAQVLRYSLLVGPSHYTINISTHCPASLWGAILGIREGVSSCAADLFNLLAELLAHDCASFLSCLGEMRERISLDSILRKLSDFIDDDSIHVKKSCLFALRLVAGPITKAVIDGAVIEESGVKSTVDCTTTLCQILSKLFETHFIPDYVRIDDGASGNEHKGSVDLAKDISNFRNQAWAALVTSLAHISQSNETESTCREIVDDAFTALSLRYLGIRRSPMVSKGAGLQNQSYQLTRISNEIATEIQYHSILSSAHALAQFVEKIHSEEQFNIFSEKMRSILQSPWSNQCEAGYLLHTSMAALIKPDPTGKPFFMKYLTIMLDFISGAKTPTCILLGGNEIYSNTLNDPKVQSICDNGLAVSLGSSDDCTSGEIVVLWQKVFQKSGISFHDMHATTSKTSFTKGSMRLLASISGALVACGPKYLPPKVSPIIRGLTTSLKNEDSYSRRAETCRSIARLVSSLSADPIHAKARNKLIENLCSMACDGSADGTCSSKGAKHVIELLIGNIREEEKIEDFSPIWDRLSPLLDEGASQHQRANAILMLSVVSMSVRKDCPSFKHVLGSFARAAVNVACADKALGTYATESITNLCRTDFCATMDVIVSVLLLILTNLEDDQGREGGSKLLLSILRNFEVLVAPYVKSLLPVCMRLMTDSMEECSRSAASGFAILVRIAPLAASHLSKEVGKPSNVNKSHDVIDHLILGKPLPPCELPGAILSQLRKNGTELRPYQMEGISWLNFLRNVRLNGSLCDDMGLGKTLQALIAVAISHQYEPGGITGSAAPAIHVNKKSLVVCPSSVVGHWVSEIGRFFPGNLVFVPFDFTGSAKSRRAAWHNRVRKSNIVITSYSVLRSDIDLLKETMWNYCILDEGHLLKNPKTATAKASRRLRSRHRLILTGTPIQNNVHEIWASFDFLMPNFLGTSTSFMSEFAKPIIKGQSSEASAADIDQGMERLKTLHQQVLPFVLRREKTEVIAELPPKIIADVPCSLSRQQHVMYQKVMRSSGTKEALDVVDSSLDETDGKPKDPTGPPELGTNVLRSLLQLRLICTHPLLHVLSTNNTSSGGAKNVRGALARLDCSGKLSVLNDLLRHAGIAEPEICAADNDASGLLIDTDMCSEDSSVVDCIEDTFLEDSLDTDSHEATCKSKCLIFAQFNQSLDIVERLLFEPHMPSLQYLRLDGRVPCNQRNSVVDRFNQDPNIKVLLLTTKVGGLGLNLTGADKVIFLEPDWNPFVDIQAMDRAHRIGQTKTVNVYRLVTSDTIEEKMMRLQQRKKATSDAVVNADNSTMFSMGTDRLLDIFTCRGDSSLARMAMPAKNGGEGDDILSYLDDGHPDEYSSLTVDDFLQGLL